MQEGIKYPIWRDFYWKSWQIDFWKYRHNFV